MNDFGFESWWESKGSDLAPDHISQDFVRNIAKLAYTAGYEQSVSDDPGNTRIRIDDAQTAGGLELLVSAPFSGIEKNGQPNFT